MILSIVFLFCFYQRAQLIKNHTQMKVYFCTSTGIKILLNKYTII